MDTIILGRVRRIAADIFAMPIDHIEPESSPETIERWDSLQHVNLMLALEQEFGLQITPEDIERLVSIKNIVMFVNGKTSAENFL